MSGERNSGKSHSKSLYALRVCTKQLNKGGIYRTMEPIIIPKLVHNSLFYIIVSTANEQKITQPHAAICSKFQVINSTLYFESQINKRVATANGKRICTQCTYTMHLHMASAPKIEIAHSVFFSSADGVIIWCVCCCWAKSTCWKSVLKRTNLPRISYAGSYESSLHPNSWWKIVYEYTNITQSLSQFTWFLGQRGETARRPSPMKWSHKQRTQTTMQLNARVRRQSEHVAANRNKHWDNQVLFQYCTRSLSLYQSLSLYWYILFNCICHGN